MTEIYENAFKMKNLYPGQKSGKSGQPRNDSYFHTDREAIFKKLQMAGVEADPKEEAESFMRLPGRAAGIPALIPAWMPMRR